MIRLRCIDSVAVIAVMAACVPASKPPAASHADAAPTTVAAISSKPDSIRLLGTTRAGDGLGWRIEAQELTFSSGKKIRGVLLDTDQASAMLTSAEADTLKQVLDSLIATGRNPTSFQRFMAWRPINGQVEVIAGTSLGSAGTSVHVAFMDATIILSTVDEIHAFERSVTAAQAILASTPQTP